MKGISLSIRRNVPTLRQTGHRAGIHRVQTSKTFEYAGDDAHVRLRNNDGWIKRLRFEPVDNGHVGRGLTPAAGGKTGNGQCAKKKTRPSEQPADAFFGNHRYLAGTLLAGACAGTDSRPFPGWVGCGFGWGVGAGAS